MTVRVITKEDGVQEYDAVKSAETYGRWFRIEFMAGCDLQRVVIPMSEIARVEVDR